MALRRTIDVTEDGRMNLPAEFRRILGLNGAGRIVLTQDAEGIHLTAAAHALRQARALAAPFRGASASVVDEFLAERRAADRAD